MIFDWNTLCLILAWDSLQCVWRSDKFNQREFLVSQTWGICVVFAGSCHETSSNRPYICVQLTAMRPGTGRHRWELLYDKERNTTWPLWRDMVHCLNLCTKDNARSQMCQCLLPLTKRQYVGRCHRKRVRGRRIGRDLTTQRWRGTSRRDWLNAPRLLSWEQELALGELCASTIVCFTKHLMRLTTLSPGY